MNTKTITSVGIDLGTTTTQVIFSRLTLINRAPASQVPAYEFIDREVIYQSPIVFTPIDHVGVIDNHLLAQFIELQVQAANININDIDSGAIIITGETAKAKNAYQSILALSQNLGDFVVATAGPHLESIIAGRGSGAQKVSEQSHIKVINIDIGGGTANYVVFDCGRVVDTACVNIGGRLLQFDENYNVVYLSSPGALVVRDLFGEALTVKQITKDHIHRLSQRMANVLVEIIKGAPGKLAGQLFANL